MSDKLTPYENEEYDGRFNLKKAERELIIKASKKCAKDRGRMAAALKITTRSLYIKMTRHGLTKDV